MYIMIQESQWVRGIMRGTVALSLVGGVADPYVLSLSLWGLYTWNGIMITCIFQ